MSESKDKYSFFKKNGRPITTSSAAAAIMQLDPQIPIEEKAPEFAPTSMPPRPSLRLPSASPPAPIPTMTPSASQPPPHPMISTKRVQGAATPGGTNFIFSLPVGPSPKPSPHTPTIASLAAATSASPPYSSSSESEASILSSSSSGSSDTSSASGRQIPVNGYSNGYTNGIGHTVPASASVAPLQQPYLRPMHSPIMVKNPFENNGTPKFRGGHTGKRKYSDPDLHGSYHLASNGQRLKSPSSSATGENGVCHRLTTWLLSKIRSCDAKKNDELHAHENGQPANGHFSSYKFSAALSASPSKASSTKLKPLFSVKNIAFMFCMTFVLTGFYIWYTHDCSHELEDAELDADLPLTLLAKPGEDGGHLKHDHHTPLNPASEPGGAVANYLGIHSLQEFEMKYPFMHPVLHFFKRPVDHSTHNHAALQKAKPKVPFTLVGLLRDMTPDFLAENKASYIFQYNALLSWVRLTPYVIIYMDTLDSCNKLTSRSEFKTVKCFPVPCIHETVHRPLLNCIFEHSHQTSTTEAMGFVNGDIILSDNIKPLIDKIGNEFQKYLVVSRRTDTLLPEYLIDAFIANYKTRERVDYDGSPFEPASVLDSIGITQIIEDNVESVKLYAAEHGVLHSEFGIDLFLYPKSTFQWMFPQFPPFLAGVYRWDNYFLTKMILHPDVSTIDASSFGLVIHQQIDSGKDHSKRTGAAINDGLVKQHLGSIYKLGHIKNVDYVLQGQCHEKCELVPNANASVHVLYAKRANQQNWLAVIHVNANEYIELNNFICWSNRINFRNFLFLTRDRKMYEEISRRDMPVIFLDRTAVDTGLNARSSTTPTDELNPELETASGMLQRYDFLFSILKAGYHFFYASVRAIYLEDPLNYFISPHQYTMPGMIFPPSSMIPGNAMVGRESEANDITVRGNATHILTIPYQSPLAIRSTTYGQYFWKQVHDCTDMNRHIADPLQWIHCLQHLWKTFKQKGTNGSSGGLKKGTFDEKFFVDQKSFFQDKSSLLQGYHPIMIQDDSVTENVNKFTRLKSWGLMATKVASPVCYDDLPSHRASIFKPPTTEPTQDFRLKIRVLTFNRHASLKRLLNILALAQYAPEDVVDLEISIDYPLNMSDVTLLDEWRTTQLAARSFTWTRGSFEVIQQSTHIGLTGQWTRGWFPKEDNKEIVLFLEDDTGVSPYYYSFIKRMVRTYYLNPNNYDPNLYGFALQTQHTILGETTDPDYRYGMRKVPEILNATALQRGDPYSTRYFRYQLVGTWGGVFFPQHWREFLIWLREKEFVHAEGTAPHFQPCVPTLLSNAWWQKKPHKVWSQWFVRFAFEKGWYNMYTNFPNQLSLVGNFREPGENFAVTKGLMNEMVDEINTPFDSPLYHQIHHDPLPLPVSSIPLYDFHFNEITNSESLKYRLGIWGQDANIPQCLTVGELLKQQKEADNKLKLKIERQRKEAEKREKEGETSILASFAALESTMHAVSKKAAPLAGLPMHPNDHQMASAPPPAVPAAAAAAPTPEAATKAEKPSTEKKPEVKKDEKKTKDDSESKEKEKDKSKDAKKKDVKKKDDKKKDKKDDKKDKKKDEKKKDDKKKKDTKKDDKKKSSDDEKKKKKAAEDKKKKEAEAKKKKEAEAAAKKKAEEEEAEDGATSETTSDSPSESDSETTEEKKETTEDATESPSSTSETSESSPSTDESDSSSSSSSDTTESTPEKSASDEEEASSEESKDDK